MVALNFDAAQHTPKYGSTGALPAGNYTVVISETSAQQTKNGQGQMLVLELRVVDGPLQGGTHTDRLNIFNQNAQAVQIANNALAAYMAVMGLPRIGDTNELCNRPFKIEIGPQKDGEYTEVKKLFDMNGNPPEKAGQAPQVQQQAPPQAPPAGFAATSAAPSQPAWGAPPAPPPPAAPPTQAWAPPTNAAPAATPPWGAPPAG